MMSSLTTTIFSLSGRVLLWRNLSGPHWSQEDKNKTENSITGMR